MVTSLQNFHTTGSIINVKISFAIPKDKWLSIYSLKYSDLQFSLLSTLSLSENQGNCLIQVKGDSLTKYWDEFSTVYDSKKYQLILQDSQSMLMNVIFESPWVLFTLMEPQLIILFPIVIRKGEISINLIAPSKKIETIFKKPFWKDLGLKIKYLGKYCSCPKLTKHQNQILYYALDYGLFDIPRKESLTDAAHLISEKSADSKISVSALSENLRRISKKLSESYVKCLET
ncbi:MAG: helix-turn-helix domain-containing protein [Promethearchaeota archaeon]